MPFIKSRDAARIETIERAKCENNLMLKRKNALNNIPQARLSLISPYPEHTYSQLEMRRKIEILKHSNNSKISKNQKWSMLVKGNTQNASQEFVNNTTKTECPNDVFLPTLSSSCDIPGKVFILQLDPKVPLYNYIEDNNRTFN